MIGVTPALSETNYQRPLAASASRFLNTGRNVHGSCKRSGTSTVPVNGAIRPRFLQTGRFVHCSCEWDESTKVSLHGAKRSRFPSSGRTVQGYCKRSEISTVPPDHVLVRSEPSFLMYVKRFVAFSCSWGASATLHLHVATHPLFLYTGRIVHCLSTRSETSIVPHEFSTRGESSTVSARLPVRTKRKRWFIAVRPPGEWRMRRATSVRRSSWDTIR